MGKSLVSCFFMRHSVYTSVARYTVDAIGLSIEATADHKHDEQLNNDALHDAGHGDFGRL